MYMPYAHMDCHGWVENLKLAEEVAKAINGEYSAILCYGKLAALAPTSAEKNRILEIRQDEIKHYQIFSQIYLHLTGRLPQPKITETCPDEYRKGLEFSFKDEQETVDRYLDIAEQTANPFVQEPFRRAAADEQNHAVWFLYFLHRPHHVQGKPAM